MLVSRQSRLLSENEVKDFQGQTGIFDLFQHLHDYLVIGAKDYYIIQVPLTKQFLLKVLNHYLLVKHRAKLLLEIDSFVALGPLVVHVAGLGQVANLVDHRDVLVQGREAVHYVF